MKVSIFVFIIFKCLHLSSHFTWMLNTLTIPKGLNVKLTLKRWCTIIHSHTLHIKCKKIKKRSKHCVIRETMHRPVNKPRISSLQMRTWDCLVAPVITDDTLGFTAHHAMASWDRVTPNSSAIGCKPWTFLRTSSTNDLLARFYNQIMNTKQADQKIAIISFLEKT